MLLWSSRARVEEMVGEGRGHDHRQNLGTEMMWSAHNANSCILFRPLWVAAVCGAAAGVCRSQSRAESCRARPPARKQQPPRPRPPLRRRRPRSRRRFVCTFSYLVPACLFLRFSRPVTPSPSPPMGQSSSRNRASRRPPPTPAPPAHALEASVRDDAPPPASPLPDTAREGPSTAKRSRHSSFRRSILGLLPSNSSSSASTRTRKESVASSSEGQQSLRKRWRSSRRWSKAPAQIAELTAGPSHEQSITGADRDVGAGGGSTLGVAEVIPIGAPSHLSRTPTPSPATRSPSPYPTGPTEGPSEESSDVCCRPLLHSDTPADSLPAVSTVPEAASAQPATVPSIVHPTTEDIEREVNEFLNGPADSPLPTAEPTPEAQPSPDGAPTAAEAPIQQTPSPRHFPPPGTLVVVQGVVNTTDSPQASQPATNHANASQRLPATSSQTLPASVSRHRSLSTPQIGRAHV